jgi:hypothetical protein
MESMQNLPFDASPVFEQAARGGILTYKRRTTHARRAGLADCLDGDALQL